ncbi:MAG: hypothetical protein R3B09_23215 [Nannocystaceae bacterium]
MTTPRPAPSPAPRRPERAKSRSALGLRVATRLTPRLTPRVFPRLFRLAALGLAALGLAAPVAGCHRKEMPRVEVFDGDSTPPETEAIGALAPPWPPAERAILGDNLLVHWLHEDGSPQLHLRLLLPTHGVDAISPAAAAVVAEGLALEIRRINQRYGVTVGVERRVDRLEVAVHGREQDLDGILLGLGRVVGVADAQPLLLRARDAAAGSLTAIDGETLALGALVSALVGGEAARERVDAAAIASTSGDELAKAWKELVDPARVMMIVHSGRPVPEALLARLGAAWPARGLLGGKGPDAALDRLRPAKRSEPSGPPRRLLADPAATIGVIVTPSPMRSGPSLYLGRSLALPDARSRSLARLAQRLLQEEYDARLTIVGDRGIFVIRLGIARTGKAVAPEDDAKAAKASAPTEGDPRVARLRQGLDGYVAFLRARHSRQRLAQAAELWLGARMVQASLTGEDWTALWSESIDLSGRDGEIAGALARDAKALLAVTPDDLSAWFSEWLDFRKGKAGWAWVAVGGDADLPAALRGLAPTEALSP